MLGTGSHAFHGGGGAPAPGHSHTSHPFTNRQPARHQQGAIQKNKTELIDKISERTGVSKSDTEKVLKGFEEIAQQVVASGGEKLTLTGFMSIEQVQRKARTGRNPQTGETIQVPASTAVKLTAGATLKDVAKGNRKPA